MEYIMLTLLNLLFFAIIIFLISRYLMKRQVDSEIKQLYQDLSSGHNDVIKEEDLAALPAPVQKWLRSSKVVGKEKIQTARLQQKGQMRTAPEAAWMTFSAVQYFNFTDPGFIWYATIKSAPLVYIAGRDKFYQGQGNMLIKLMSLFKVADAFGNEMNQGSLVRYLAEIVNQPTAALDRDLQWEGINEQSARATMTYRGITAAGVFEFNQEGDVIGFSAPRYREQGGKYTLDDWYIKTYDHKEFEGIRAPARGEVIWKLAEGDFNWFQFEVTDIKFDGTKF